MEYKINESLLIQSEFIFSEITYFMTKWSVNAHGYLELEGEISYESALQCQKKSLRGSSITLKIIDNAEEKIVFNGLLKNFSLMFEGRTVRIKLIGITATWIMDIGKKSRSFQDTEITYASAAKKVASDTGAGIITTSGGETKLKKPLIQYMETDWEFLKRISSHLGSGLISDVKTGKPAFWFGMRHGRTIPPLPEYSYDRKMNFATMRPFYKVKSREIYQIGDRTTFLGRSAIIHTREVEFLQGEVIASYTVGDEFVFKHAIRYNERIKGVGLSGRVIQVKGEEIAIALEIDRGQDTGLFWYPWRPETGNIMYAMPEIGSPVLLTVFSHDEREAVTTACLHREGAEKNKKKSYSNRTMEIPDGALIDLYPKKIRLSKSKGKSSLELRDADGIHIDSNKKIIMEAEESIRLKARTIIVKASDEIEGIIG